jgi:MarR family transcriptional regulator, transcriptional regulator for hemolysin
MRIIEPNYLAQRTRALNMPAVKLSRKLKIGVLVHETSRLRRKAIDQLLKPMGITGTQWWVLTSVSLRPGLSQARLADELSLGKVALGGLIERLNANGLIDRRPDAQDKRVNLIYLSAAGLNLVKNIKNLSSGVQDAALDGISLDEIDSTISVLERMMANLEKVSSRGFANNIEGVVAVQPSDSDVEEPDSAIADWA